MDHTSRSQVRSRPHQHQASFNPGTVWLITPRTRPAWTAIIDLLDDGNWKPIELVAQVMRDTADLAPRTIASHLRSASRRGWTQRHGNLIRLRNRELIELALDCPCDRCSPHGGAAAGVDLMDAAGGR